MIEDIRMAMKQPTIHNITTSDAPERPVRDYDVRDEFAAMAEYKTASQLFLDDIGDIKFTDWNVSQLQLLVNYRYENLLPMVITSNLSLDELSDAIGDNRVSSRINRFCLIQRSE
jgi:DNA replication protein DnaC